MSDAEIGKSDTGPKKPRQSIEQKIAEAQKMLEALKKKKAEEDKKASEKNMSAIMALLKEQNLDQVAIEKWTVKVGQIAEVLK